MSTFAATCFVYVLSNQISPSWFEKLVEYGRIPDDFNSCAGNNGFGVSTEKRLCWIVDKTTPVHVTMIYLFIIIAYTKYNRIYKVTSLMFRTTSLLSRDWIKL